MPAFVRWSLLMAFAAATAGCASQSVPSAFPSSENGAAVRTASPFAARHLYVSEFGPSRAVFEYPLQNGIPAARPDRVLRGLKSPNSIAIDSEGNLFVLDEYEVKEFAAGATGRARPIREIYVPSGYGALAVDSNGYLYVGQSGFQVFVYAPNASGHAQPIATLGAAGYLAGLTVDANDHLFALGDSQQMHPKLVFQMHVSVFENPKLPTRIRDFCTHWLPNLGYDSGVAVDLTGHLFTSRSSVVHNHPHGEIDVFPVDESTCPVDPSAEIHTQNPALLGPVYVTVQNRYLYAYDSYYGNGGAVFTLRTTGKLQTPLSILYLNDKQPHTVEGIGVGP